MNFKANYPEKGITIVETVISISVLSIAITGIFASFSFMVILSNEASDQLLANYLAQEGLEIIRNIRDSNWIQNEAGSEFIAWDQGLSVCEFEQGGIEMGCEVDYRTTGRPPYEPTLWQERFLKQDAENLFYNYEQGENTKFKRKITINTSLAPYILKVKVEVFWNKKPTLLNPLGTGGRVELEETLYDWFSGA